LDLPEPFFFHFDGFVLWFRVVSVHICRGAARQGPTVGVDFDALNALLKSQTKRACEKSSENDAEVATNDDNDDDDEEGLCGRAARPVPVSVRRRRNGVPRVFGW
jgi:hypothetical protein